ncbi:MAG: hypothetical protein LBK94_09470 [Prevotellaceae bacterium]|jgi:hypothetical protein|nr:hypothetical protein [Prevotellaceae bacterium]
MAKKKKKVNLHAQQKLQTAHLKKLYMERLRKLCTLIGNGEPLFDLLPQHILEAIYASRGITIRIRVANNVKLTKRFVKIMYRHLENEMKEAFVSLMHPDGNTIINLIDYYQVAMPLEIILMKDSTRFPGKEKFNDHCAMYKERFTDYFEKFINIVRTACVKYSEPDKRILYTHKYGSRREKNMMGGLMYQIITLDIHLLDIRYVDIHNDRRPVIQVGEIIYEGDDITFIPTTISTKWLYKNGSSKNRTFPVYIQQHAFKRTMQRVCLNKTSLVHALILLAFDIEDHSQLIREGNRFLVECYCFHIKIGYFVGMLIDGMFVILTFLLITHNSTPEGRKLAQLTGLQRDDMTFLAIDDLKTLVNSDIAKDPRIVEIFRDAGCESILTMNNELHTKGFYDWLWDDAKQDTELSKLIAEYIQLGDNDREYFENE